MKALLYCNKKKPYLYKMPNNKNEWFLDSDLYRGNGYEDRFCSGKICAEVDCDVEESKVTHISASHEPVIEYFKSYNIKDVKILDKPYTIDYLTHTDWRKYIDECIKRKGWCNRCYSQKNPKQWIGCSKGRVKTPIPYIIVLDTEGHERLLLTCEPEELCDILNKKQTILIRKR